MKKFFLLLLATQLYIFNSNGQIFITTNGNVQFFSKTPMEDISATNFNVASIINVGKDSISVRMRNTLFVFKNALMQEHFNENYMESTKYPFDEFSGKLSAGIDYNKDGVYPVTATGKLKIHGAEKNTAISGTITVKQGTVRLDATFMVHTSDFNIEIPKLVFEKIAQDIKVTMSADYKALK